MQLPQREELILGLAGFFDVSLNGLVKFAYPTQNGGPGRGTIQDSQRGIHIGLRILPGLGDPDVLEQFVRRHPGHRFDRQPTFHMIGTSALEIKIGFPIA